MTRVIIRLVGIFLIVVSTVAVLTLTWVDRTPYQNSDYYTSMRLRLDSLNQALQIDQSQDNLQIGWSSVNITPLDKTPMAGYGARAPMVSESILDSVFIRTITISQGIRKSAIVTADLLLIHPEVDEYVSKNLPENWSREEIYYTASHTHASIGGWAPGIAGEIFAGEYDAQQGSKIGDGIIKSLELAEQNFEDATLGYGEIIAGNLVKNRLVKEKGIIDPWFKVLSFKKGSLSGFLNFFSAHATTLSYDNKSVSGDYPAALHSLLLADPNTDFVAFAAGAVGSMSPKKLLVNEEENRQSIATDLSEQHRLFRMLGGDQQTMKVSLNAFRISLSLPEPTFKLTKNIAIRPYIFRKAFGNYSAEISVLILGKTIMIGLPVEFSGELAVPLYDYAKSLDMNLIITSFNGDYGGYVVKDEWYDLEKYEARTMSWQGPYAGSYLSEVIEELIRIIHEHQ